MQGSWVGWSRRPGVWLSAAFARDGGRWPAAALADPGSSVAVAGAVVRDDRGVRALSLGLFGVAEPASAEPVHAGGRVCRAGQLGAGVQRSALSRRALGDAGGHAGLPRHPGGAGHGDRVAA